MNQNENSDIKINYLTKHQSTVYGIAQNKKYLASSDSTLFVYNKNSLEKIFEKKNHGIVTAIQFFHNLEQIAFTTKGNLHIYDLSDSNLITTFTETTRVQETWKFLITPNDQYIILPIKYGEISILYYDGSSLSKIKTIFQNGAVWDMSYRNGKIFSVTEKGFYSIINDKFQKIKEKELMTETSMTSIVHIGDDKLVIGYECQSTLKFYKMKTKSIKEYDSFQVEKEGELMVRNLCLHHHFLLFCSVSGDHKKRFLLRVFNLRKWVLDEFVFQSEVMNILSDEDYVYVSLNQGEIYRLTFPKLSKDNFQKQELSNLYNISFYFF